MWKIGKLPHAVGPQDLRSQWTAWQRNRKLTTDTALLLSTVESLDYRLLRPARSFFGVLVDESSCRFELFCFLKARDRPAHPHARAEHSAGVVPDGLCRGIAQRTFKSSNSGLSRTSSTHRTRSSSALASLSSSRGRAEMHSASTSSCARRAARATHMARPRVRVQPFGSQARRSGRTEPAF